ncbi:MAG: type I CRISPR-associated protein Cas7 [Pirellulales bacterium]
MFEHDHSAARGEMSTCNLFVFEHDSKLGSSPARKLFSLIRVELKDPSLPPRKFEDYQVTIERDKLPTGVALHERL